MPRACKYIKKRSRTGFCIFAIALLIPLTAAAQDLHESFTVLGEYIPDIIRQDKIHTLPSGTLFTMPASPMPYSTTGVTGNITPSIGVVDPPLWRAQLRKAPRGYIDFGIGNHLNMTGSAGYRFINTPATQAGLWLRHNSWWGFRPDLYEKNLADDRLGLYLRHSFNAGTLAADLQYHGAWFNYYGSSVPTPNRHAPTQTIVNPSAEISWKSTDIGQWSYATALRYHYFSFRRFQQMKGQKENAIALDANLAYRLNERSTLALDMRTGAYLYSNPLADRNNNTDYGLISLTPNYRLTANCLRLTAGADLALAIHAGRSLFAPVQRHTRLFYAAPHIDLSYSRGITALSLHAKGGLKANTLCAAADADIYTTPVLVESTPQYSPIDARIALALNPHRTITTTLGINYAITRGIYPNGDYMAHIADNRPTTTTTTIRGFIFDADISLKPTDRFGINASLRYSPQNNHRGYFNGYDRPRWILNTTAQINPTDRITVALNYNYRGVRKHYRTLIDGTTTTTRLRDLTYLNANASWRIIAPLTIWVQARNILGCRADILPGQPAPGITLTAGFALTF